MIAGGTIVARSAKGLASGVNIYRAVSVACSVAVCEEFCRRYRRHTLFALVKPRLGLKAMISGQYIYRPLISFDSAVARISCTAAQRQPVAACRRPKYDSWR